MEYYVRMNHRENVLEDGATGSIRHSRIPLTLAADTSRVQSAAGMYTTSRSHHHDKWSVCGGELGAIGTAKPRSISYGDATPLLQPRSPVAGRHRVYSVPQSPHSDAMSVSSGIYGRGTDLVDDAFIPHAFKNKVGL